MMTDLISRQAAIDRFENLSYADWNQGASTTWASAFSECADMIRELPSEYVVEVVRCKDCKYYYYAENRIPSERGWACANDGCYASQNDYCSWGERIDG